MGEPLGGPYQIVSFLWRSARPVCFPFPGAFAVISCRMRVRCLTLVRSSPQTVRGRAGVSRPRDRCRARLYAVYGTLYGGVATGYRAAALPSLIYISQAQAYNVASRQSED